MIMDIQRAREIMAPILKEAGVIRASFFGSLARGEATAASDVDLLVELPQGKSLFDLIALKLKLEEASGRSVDILTFQSIYPPLRSAIERELLTIL
jgi:predicted nucleotidyltransferase